MSVDPLLTLPEICQLFRVSQPAMKRAVKLGLIPTVRFGVEVRFAPAQIRRWLDDLYEEWKKIYTGAAWAQRSVDALRLRVPDSDPGTDWSGEAGSKAP